MKQWWKRGGIMGAAFLLFVWCLPIQAQEQNVPEELQQLYAQSAVLMDADSGRILFEKNGQQVRAMASTTKIMTLIVALENGDPESIVTVSEYAAGMPDVQLNIQKGEQFRLLDLLYSLMLESHNDSAVAIAEHVAAGMQETGQTQRANDQASQRTQQESRTLVASFASLMNAKARDIGCYDTHFVTPNGLDGEDEGGSHATTAADLARILRYCMIQSPRKSEFLEITGQASYSFVNQAGNRSFTVNNHNAFLQMMDGALTGKTGFTSKAGYCYVGALSRDGKTYIAALLACGWPNHKSYKWSDMRKLMNYALERYTYQRFDSAGFDIDVIDPIPVDGAQGQVLGEQVLVNVKVSQAENEKSRMDGLLLRDDEKIQVEWNVVKKLEAPVEAGTPVGKVQYLVNGEVFKTELLTAADTVQEINLNWCMKQVVKGYLI